MAIQNRINFYKTSDFPVKKKLTVSDVIIMDLSVFYLIKK